MYQQGPNPFLIGIVWNRWLFVLALVAVLLGLVPVSAQAELQFRCVFNESSTGNRQVNLMAKFGGKLFIATTFSSSSDNDQIYRMFLPGCDVWDNVTPANLKLIWSSMAAFDPILFVGGYRTSDGFNFIPVPGVDGTPFPLGPMAVFNDKLYASDFEVKSGGTIIRTTDGVTWEKFSDLPQSSYLEGNPQVESLAVFNNQLYMGIAFNNIFGIEIWKTDGVAPWTLVHQIHPGPESSAPGHVHAMKAYKGYLYIAPYSDGGYGTLCRTDGTPGSWEKLPQITPVGNITALEVHDGVLYAGAFDFWTAPNWLGGLPLLYFSSNGTDWSPVPGFVGWYGGNGGVRSLMSFNGSLYAGTFKGSGGQVFEIAENLSTCPFKFLYYLLRLRFYPKYWFYK